jgi:hypothetical protein
MRALQFKSTELPHLSKISFAHENIRSRNEEIHRNTALDRLPYNESYMINTLFTGNRPLGTTASAGPRQSAARQDGAAAAAGEPSSSHRGFLRKIIDSLLN